MYVAGLDREDRPIGDWSMSITSLMCSLPVSSSCSPARTRLSCRSEYRRFWTVAWMSELFPDPEAPVTHTNCPSGTSTRMFFRLLWRAPRTTIDLVLLGGGRAGG